MIAGTAPPSIGTSASLKAVKVLVRLLHYEGPGKPG